VNFACPLRNLRLKTPCSTERGRNFARSRQRARVENVWNGARSESSQEGLYLGQSGWGQRNIERPTESRVRVGRSMSYQYNAGAHPSIVTENGWCGGTGRRVLLPPYVHCRMAYAPVSAVLRKNSRDESRLDTSAGNVTLEQTSEAWTITPVQSLKST
jgi:hypothetical protein